MSGILWLASYPKSGNTWFRAFVANLLSDSEEPVDINTLSTGLIASARDPFDDYAGVEASDLTPDEIDRLRPEVYRKWAEEEEGPQIHKIHDAYLPCPSGEPLVPPEATQGVLYFLRNPLDVAISYAHHADRDLDTVIGWMSDDSHCFCANPRRLHFQLRQRLLTWSGHVESWLEAPGIEVEPVRYEDMHREPEATFTRAARFAGLDHDPEQVRRALELSSFEVLRAQEEEHGFIERHPRAESFFRQGKVGTWRGTLSEAQATRIVADHRQMMERFGYLDEVGNPVF